MFEDTFPSVNSYPVDDNPAGVTNSIPTASGGIGDWANRLLGQAVNYSLQKDQLDNQRAMINGANTVQNSGVSSGTAIIKNGQVNTARVTQLAVAALAVVAVIAGSVWAFKKLA